MTTPDPVLARVLPLMLGARLLDWVEGPAKVEPSDSDSEILHTADSRWAASSGVSSSGMVGIVMDMRVRSVRGGR